MAKSSDNQPADEQQEEQDTKPDRSPHLKKFQFQPGTSGNPKGRPKGSVGMWGRIQAKLKARGLTDDEIADQVADVFVARLLEGDFKFHKELIDRDEGPVPKEVKHQGLGGMAGAISAIDEAMAADETPEGEE